LVLEILKGKTTVAEAARRYDLKPSEIKAWLDEGIRGMENSLRPGHGTSENNMRPSLKRLMLP